MNNRRNSSTFKLKAKYINLASLTIFALLLISLADGEKQAKVTPSGWTVVSNRWPANAPSYFVAIEKGHHFIEAKLPVGIEGDLKVKFMYFFSFAQLSPTIEIVPCNKKEPLIWNGATQPADQWLEHEFIVKSEDCKRRPELAYNIILHNKDDVFAWSSFDIVSVTNPTITPDETSSESFSQFLPDNQATTQMAIPFTYAPEKTIEPTENPSSWKTPEDKHSNDITKPDPYLTTESTTLESTHEATTESATHQTPFNLPDNKDKDPKSIDSNEIETEKPIETSKPEVETITEGEKVDETTPWATTQPSFDLINGKISEEPKDVTVEPNESSNKPELVTITPNFELPTSRPQSPERQEANQSPKRIPDNESGDERKEQLLPKDSRKVKPSKRRFKRGANDAEASPSGTKTIDGKEIPEESTSSPIRQVHFSCTPKSCNRDRFQMARFTQLDKGVPQMTESERDSGNTLVLNTNEKPFKLHLESPYESFADVDTCVNLKLFMDPGTSLALNLANPTDERRSRPLEVINRKDGDSTASKWEEFSRCISDYMPKLPEDTSQDHSMDLELIPGPTQKGKQMAIMYDPKRIVELRGLYKTHKYIPNINGLIDGPQRLDYFRLDLPNNRFDNFWVLDKDGIEKPKVNLITQEIDVDGKAKKQVKKKLKISDIDTTQESFDITSRWLELNESEIAGNPIILTYKADNAQWIESIIVEFQRTGWSADKWRGQEVYKASAESSEPKKEDIEAKPSELKFPIKLLGVGSDIFRLRLKHVMKKEASAKGDKVELTINSLAFADACASEKFCFNGGLCKPKGTASATCICEPGYSGAHCETKQACDVIVDNSNGLSGRSLCRLIGAECVENLPELRCIWPNDQYFECQSLFRSDTDGELIPVPPAQESKQKIDGDLLNELKDKAMRQTKMIIILGVFMAALLVFALVLGVNMVSRVRKYRRRLEKSQVEIHELSRRNVPGTSRSSPFVGSIQSSRLKPAAVIGYNNNAFDVE